MTLKSASFAPCALSGRETFLQTRSCGGRSLLSWRSMCSIAVVFSEAAHVMPADQTYFCTNTNYFRIVFIQCQHLYWWTTSVSTHLMCVHKTGMTEQSKHVCLLDGGLWPWFLFCREIEHVVSQFASSVRWSETCESQDKGHRRKVADTSFPHTAHQMAG